MPRLRAVLLLAWVVVSSTFLTEPLRRRRAWGVKQIRRQHLRVCVRQRRVLVAAVDPPDDDGTIESSIDPIDQSEPVGDSVARSDDGTRDPEFDLELQPERQRTPKNPVLQLASRMSTTDIVGRFMESAPDRVKNAMKTTVIGLLGSTEKFAIDAATTTTAENLANLMFQLQMTGYMFRNAEYRLSLSQSLKGFVLGGESVNPDDVVEVEEESLEERVKDKSKISGTIKVTTDSGDTIEVDADAYVAELRDEVNKLRGSLARIQQRKEEETGMDLIQYVQSLPRDEMQQLTTEVSQEVLDAMESLVKGVLRTIPSEGDEIILESMGSLSKLCMWQLVTGYNLREIEVKEAMRKNLESGDGDAEPPEQEAI